MFKSSIFKQHSSGERIVRASERQLKEYAHFTSHKRLDTYLTVLKPAILNLYEVLSNTPGHNYPVAQLEHLKKDALHLDIELIPYNTPDNKVAYLSYKEAKSLRYPKDEYETLDICTGKCKKFNSVEFISVRIAIDYSLDVICNRWLKEIEKILEAIVDCDSENEE